MATTCSGYALQGYYYHCYYLLSSTCLLLILYFLFNWHKYRRGQEVWLNNNEKNTYAMTAMQIKMASPSNNSIHSKSHPGELRVWSWGNFFKKKFQTYFLDQLDLRHPLAHIYLFRNYPDWLRYCPVERLQRQDHCRAGTLPPNADACRQFGLRRL